MSHYLNLEENESNFESEDIDALNDETFGCDVGDINDDWEEEHEKYVGKISPDHDSSQECSSQFVDTGSIVHTILEPEKTPKSYKDDLLHLMSDKQQQQQQRSFLNFNDDILFPSCEDLITKSLLDVVSDDSDCFPNDIYSSTFCHDFPDLNDSNQNGMFPNQGRSLNAKEKAKNIDLESLRPPSPSILPLDHTLMSSVWRPPSPETNVIVNNQSSCNAYINSSTQNRYSPKELPKPQTPDLCKSPKIGNFSWKNVIRAEDLEADLKDIGRNKTQTPSNIPSMPSNLIDLSSLANQGRSPMSMMEMAASLAQVSINTINPPSIPPFTSKTVQPPPGFSMSSNGNRTTTKSIFDAKSPSSIQTNNQNSLGKLPLNMERFVGPPHMMNMMNCVTKMPPNMPPHLPFPIPQNILDHHLQQQRIMHKIITPAQAQRSYHHLNNNFNRNHQNKFAGFMTQREKDWLIKIFRLQCKVNDPYVEDYYEVNYILKINSEKIMAKQKELMLNNEQGNQKENPMTLTESEPLLVLPQLAQQEESKPKYIQFDNALGKIQVLNSKCPRKLVEYDGDESKFTNYKLDLRSQYLLKIEHLYELFLNIEDEDKRMPILPEDVKPQHIERRNLLSKKLFEGLTVPISDIKKDECQFFILINRSMPTLKRNSVQVDPEILKINKGFSLVVRSLIRLEDEEHIIVLTSSLLKQSCFERILKVEQEIKVELGIALLKAINKVKNSRALTYICSNIDDASIFTNSKYGTRLLINLFNQYKLSDDKLLFIYFWKWFVKTLIKLIPETEESSQLCKDHLQYLEQL